MFEPIDRLDDAFTHNLYKSIVERIRKMIREGTLKVGDKLPSERELAELFQVSRVPVREALKILDFMGVVRYVRGEGVYVKEVAIADLVDKIDYVAEPSKDILQELFEAREAIEVKALRLACQKRTEDDIAKMDKSIEKMEKEISTGTSIVFESQHFHTLIVKASRNQILIRLHESLLDIQEMARKRSLSIRERIHQPSEFHRQILDAIIQRDADRATASMIEHLHDAKMALIKATEGKAADSM